MICSWVNRVRFISVILHKIDGLLELYIGTAGGEQVIAMPPQAVDLCQLSFRRQPKPQRPPMKGLIFRLKQARVFLNSLWFPPSLSEHY